MVTRGLNGKLSADLIAQFNIFIYVFLGVALFCISFYMYYSLQHFKTIKDITLSGAYTSEDIALKGEKNFKIIEAVYCSESRSKDVKELLQGMVLDNVLTGTANNELFGDPDHGKDKWLKIVYSVNGKEFRRQCRQGEVFQLPPNEPMKE